MIKTFTWGEKLNVVDDRNNLVGYDLGDDCCSHGGWFVSDSIEKDEPSKLYQPETLSDYVFDTAFYHEIVEPEFNAVVFKLDPQHNTPETNLQYIKSLNGPNPILYLHLFNIHNGYYAKGFVCKFAEIKEGSV